MKRSVIVVLSCLLLSLTHCGKRNIATPGVTDGDPVQLIVFGAPWCEPCEHELVDFKTMLPTALGGLASRVQVVVYVVTDINNQEPDDQEVADYAAKMKSTHGIEFKMVKDIWPYKLYRTYFDKPGPIPANVIADKTGKALKPFKAGTFKTADVVNYLVDLLN